MDFMNLYTNKVEQQPYFLTEEGIQCSCVKCKCMNILSSDEVNLKLHLYKYGFQPHYWFWIEYGEIVPHIDLGGSSSAFECMINKYQFMSLQNMVENTFCSVVMNNVGFNQDNWEKEPNVEVKRFYDLLNNANQPLYEGTFESKLSVGVGHVACKSNWNAPKGVLISLQVCFLMCHPKKMFWPQIIIMQKS